MRTSPPWTVSSSACRLVPSPEARTPTFTAGPACSARGSCRRPPEPQLGVGAAGRDEAALVEQLVDPREHLLGAEVRERAVGGQTVVGVLAHELRAPAAQDLDRARAADRGVGAVDH